MDLRKQKTKNLIRETFKEMICEMDINRITVKELTERAMINRKTFYFHYETIEFLVDELLDDVTQDYIAAFEQLPENRPHEDANAVFFRYFAAQPEWVQKIMCYPPYSELCNRVFDTAYNRALELTPNPYWKQLPQPVQNMIAIFYRSTTLDLYRQWRRDRDKLSLEDAIAISNRLICSGEGGIGAIIKNYFPNYGI